MQPKRCPLSKDLESLIQRSFDEPITSQEVELIEQALSSSVEARAWYNDLAQLHADISSAKQSLEVCRTIQIENTETPENSLLQKPVGGYSRIVASCRELGNRFPLGLATSLLAIGLGIGCGMGLFAANLVQFTPKFVVAPWNWKVGNDVIAKIVSTDNVKWQDSQTPETLPTQGLHAGQQIRIQQGLLHLRYKTGVDLIIAGPAVLEIRDERGCKLYSGNLTATCSTNIATFNIDTPTGLLQTGPGRYGVEVHEGANGSMTDSPVVSVKAFSTLTPGEQSAKFTSLSGQAAYLSDGDAIQFSLDAKPQSIDLAYENNLPLTMPKAISKRFEGSEIPLGNLFDDSKTTSLSDAIASDSFQAACETIDLGIATVHDGGLDVDLLLAEDGVVFNLANVGGGGPKVWGLPGNDTYRSVSTVPIRTIGRDFGKIAPTEKIEEGIGISSNELITFDLDELRRSGQLSGVDMRFVSERAGINDRDYEDPDNYYHNLAEVHMVAIVSTTNEVLSAHVNGVEVQTIEQGGVFSIAQKADELPRPLRYNGKFAAFDVFIPQNAKYLTLATTMLHDEDCDHAVFSGARLELLSPAESTTDPSSEE